MEKGSEFQGEVKEAYASVYFDKDYLSMLKNGGYLLAQGNEKFIPWKNFYDKKIEDKSTYLYYSQFQLLWLYKLIESFQIILDLRFFEKATQDNIWGLIKKKNEWLDLRLNSVRSRIDDYYKLTEILLAIQNRYYPYTKSDERYIRVTSSDPSFDWYEFKKSWDPKKIFKELKIRKKFLSHWYNQLVFEIHQIDDLKEWHPFIRFFTLDKKKKLKGKALLVEDFYGHAFMLKMFFEDLTGELLAHPDEGIFTIFGEHLPLKRRLESVSERLEILTNEFNVNPRPKLIFFVEGDGEYENIPLIANELGLNLDQFSIRLENLRGIGNIKNLTDFIDHYHNLGTLVYVLLDKENRVDQFKKRIVKKPSKYEYKRKITKAIYFDIWYRSYEFDNFTDKEITAALSKQGPYNFVTKEITSIRKSFSQSRKNLSYLFKNQVGRDLDKTKLAIDLNSIIISEIKSGIDLEKLSKKRKILKKLKKACELASKNYYAPINKRIYKDVQESGFFG